MSLPAGARIHRAVPRIGRAFAARCVVLGWLAVAATLLAYGGGYWWVLELAVHFRPWYVPMLLVSAACAGWLGRRMVAALMLAAALLNLLAVAPAWRGLLERNDAPPQLRVVVFNLSVRNTRTAPVVQYLARVRADVAVLLEVGEQWREPLTSLHAAYPYQLIQASADPFGIALLSAHPCSPCEVIEGDDAAPPALLGRLALHDGHLWVAAAHALPPITGAWTRARDGYLLDLGGRLASLQGARLLAGDFNTTPWAPGYRELLAAGLDDGGLVRVSWPAFLPFPVIPIDHVLASPELRIVSKQRGPDLGSDHYPLVVDLRARR
jgi:endonuclease/exonuclease/phosphatase (EEP) superfamily protein YafD